MPGTNPLADEFSVNWLRELDRRVRALETQQNSVWTDSSGRERVRVGLLPNGDYGLLVTDPTGMAREIFPVSSASFGGLLNTTSTLPVTLAGSPTLSAFLGGSGDALVTVSALFITPTVSPGSASGGRIGLTVDGINFGTWVEFGNNGGSEPSAWPSLQASCTQALKLSDGFSTVAPNAAHTFALTYQALAAVGCSWFTVGLVVEPI